MAFWLALMLGAVFLLPKMIHIATIAHPRTLESSGINPAAVLGSAFGLAAIAGSIGLNPIIGTFAAGMGLAGSKLAMQAREFAGKLKVIFMPLFFAIIGAHVNPGDVFSISIVMFLGCGVTGSILLRNKKRGMRIGYGMIARGEIAFITIGLGLSYSAIDPTLYSTMVFVILATIFITPGLLRMSFRNETGHKAS